MTTSPYTPQLRPLSVGEILDAGFRVFRERFGTLVWCVVVPVLPLSIIGTLVLASTDENAFDPDAPANTEGSAIAGTFASSFIEGAGAALAIAACFRVIGSAYLGERTSVGESLRYGLSRLVPLMVAYIVLVIALSLSAIALIIPAIFLGVKWSLTFAAIVAERAGPFAGMGRSWTLTSGHWWRTFGTLVVVVLILAVIYFALLAALGGLVAATDVGEVAYAAVLTLLSVIVSAIVNPIGAAIIAVLYYDLRVRNEGFDLQLLAQGVGADPARFAAAPERPQAPPPGTPGGGFTPPEGPAAAS